MKRLLLGLLFFSGAAALEAAASYTFSVTAGLNFQSANPDLVPLVPGDAPVVATIVIMLQAQGANLTSAAGDNIAVGNLTWTATATFTLGCPHPPCNIQNAESITATSGTQTVTTSAVNSATGYDGKASTNSDTYTGTVTHSFNFANSWLYTTGTYSQTLLFTFASP